jgi:hypothetical protein
LVDDLRVPIGDTFDLSTQEENDLDFLAEYHYCDTIQSRRFEDIPTPYFNEEELAECDAVVTATLIEPMADPVEARNLYVSKQVFIAKDRMEAIIGGKELPLKFQADSTHDWTVAQHLLWLNATNGAFLNVPFASQVVYELHSTEGCKEESCFWIEVIYNGEPLLFDCEDPARCSWSEFGAAIGDNFIQTTTRYEDECA